MATQTYVTDIQVMNPTAVQAFGLDLTSDVNGAVVKTSAANSQGGIQQGQKATIIQPAQAHSGQQFIVTTSAVDHQQLAEQAQQETISIQQGGTTVYPTHLQYVEGSDPGIYTNGQMPKDLVLKARHSYGDYTQGTMYTNVSGTYYQTAQGGQVAQSLMPVGTSVQALQGQIIPGGGGTYIIQSGTVDSDGAPLTHTTRASPVTNHTPLAELSNLHTKEVQWLIDNYETAEGVSLPRSTLYYHYLRHCQEQGLDPMNPASFGKLIRSVFLGLRTRRLGTRGNSKYHYYGIRIRANSSLNQFTDDQTMALRQQPMYTSKKLTSQKQEGSDGDGGPAGTQGGGQSDGAHSQQQQHTQFLGDASHALPSFGSVDISLVQFPDGIALDDIRAFEKMYREHAEAVVDVVVNLHFNLIENLWQTFWRNPSPDSPLDPFEKMEKRVPKDKLYILCRYEPLITWVRRSDYAFYQALVEVLIPDVLRPIPSSLTQAIRNFAKSLEGWLKNAMQNVPEEMVKTKLGAVSAFAQTLRRYTSLNHLAQAARAVLQNTSQINQMLTDLNRVDFTNVQEQASWVCQCEDLLVQQLEQDFKATLKQGNSLEQWAQWLEGVVNQVLKPHEGNENFPKAARQFLLKWSFYSSMVIRDLTLRSAASFGSFHLIRLLYDEFMFYLVEHKVANATGQTPIAVMGEVRQFHDLSSAVNLGHMDMDDDDESSNSSQPSMLSSQPQMVQRVTMVSGTPTPTTLMLVTSNSPGSVVGQTGVAVRPTIGQVGTPTITVRPASNGLTATGGLVVLSGSSVTGAAPSHTVSTTQGGLPTTLAVRTTATNPNSSKTHTILVMPVSSTGTADVTTAKRVKTE
ncbi:DNA-binding protein RFX2-like isoform X2 [Biomphalaria glabrata]|uniref:DNA-binding protein RFX2-like isoform X2 n=1 Tax=Biomphalaria glabrata TaxID=6526 RepID=A0A2C9JH96_BIOGL|nr:DNA-binding protein RFX2-like isoform X2 [Biomphalaria glabrata]